MKKILGAFLGLGLLWANIAIAQTVSPLSSGGGGGSGTPGGSNGQIQYNALGNFGGTSGATTDGTTVTLISPALSGTVTGNGTIPLPILATQAADTLVANASGSTASPTAVVIGSCSGATNALTYNTTTHAFGCNTISGGSSAITIGTTTITSGTNTRILYDNSGVVGEYTLSGTGTVVAMATSPSFTTPTLGVASATTINKVALTAPATGSTLTIVDGKTLTASNTLTFAGTDSTTMTFPTTSATMARTDVGQTFTGRNVFAGGTLGDQQQAIAVTATQPASPTGTQNAISIAVTSAGSASQINSAFSLTYGTGYSGSARVLGGSFVVSVAGTASTLIPSSGQAAVDANQGIYASAQATTTGTNIGFVGQGSNGNVSAGVVGLAQIAKNSATNIGVVGSAINTGTSPVVVGGFFSLNQTTVPTVSAALIADNGAQAQPIALFRANGTTAITISAAGILIGTTFQVTNINSQNNSFTSFQSNGSNANVIFGVAAATPLLQWGAATSSAPALKRSTTTLQARLADDSAFTNIQGKITTDNAYDGTPVVATGSIIVYDSTGTAYKISACLASGC